MSRKEQVEAVALFVGHRCSTAEIAEFLGLSVVEVIALEQAIRGTA
ncbi:hypothetical protein [Coralloluteibacterium thermophilus]|uniref:Uncharacterized protein n=1 Tax=Coralloluteibacterium thermophilum TaxID=2707049 RepID=A0ABV9NPE3_9GAMM